MRAVMARLLALLMLISAGNVQAQPGSGEAISLGHSALQHFEQENFATALELFRQADGLAHSPVFTLYIARCERSLGRLIEARLSYQAAVDEPLDAAAPEPWLTAQRNARVELAEVIARIPSIVVEATLVPSVFEVDGKALPLDRLGAEIELDPGAHRVALTARGAIAARSITVGEGQRRVRVLFEQSDWPAAALVEPARTHAPGPPPPVREAPDGRSNHAFLVPIGVGVAALAVGATAGIVAMAQHRDLMARCDGNVCPKEEAARVTSIQTWANVSTVAFGVSALGLTLGAVLYLADPGPGSGSPKTALVVSGGF